MSFLPGCGQTSEISTNVTRTAQINVLPVVENLATTTPQQVILRSENKKVLTYTDNPYKFSLDYPKEWEIIENINSNHLKSINFGQKENPNEYNPLLPQFNIVLQEESFESIVKKIEDGERMSDGTTSTKVNDVEDILVNGIHAKKGNHGTSLGIPEVFYFIPLPHQKTSLWITYHFGDKISEDVVKNVISSLKIK